MTRLALFADVHANLPALEAALAAVRQIGVDGLLFLGDAIAIGPHPAECLDLLLSQPDVTAVMGNHDAWLAHGLPQPRPEWMSDGEVAHQQWTHARIAPAQRAAVQAWPFEVALEVDGVRLYLSHYALDGTRRSWLWLGQTPTPEHFDEAYSGLHADVCLFGHDHTQRDVQGHRRYINPGALGCGPLPVAMFALLNCERGACHLDRMTAPYDDRRVLDDYERLRVPERDFLRRVFHGGR